MKVQEFVEKYNNNDRIDIAKTLEVKKYIGLSTKRELSKLVLDSCTRVVDGEIHIDSVERYILFTISVISMHTNLEFSYNDNDEHSAVDAYDMLCESGLLVKIIDTFKDDYASCQEILNMMTADKMQDNMTIEKKMYMFLDGVQNMLENSINKLIDQINVDELVKNLPANKEQLVDLFDSIIQK